MGCGASASSGGNYASGMIPDRFTSLEEVVAALKKANLESSQLMVGVDFTESNTWTGKRCFGGQPLHRIGGPGDEPNPYEQVLEVIAKALWDFDADHMIPAYGFGDAMTGSHAVFSFQKGDAPCKGLPAMLQRYKEIAACVTLHGPTSFAPIIRQAIKVVRETNEYHILLIVADGQVSPDQVQATQDAIVKASDYALSIVLVGVGDGPWDLMETFDDELPERRFDNFQFVDFNTVFNKYPTERRDAAFATHALMEVPDQWHAIKHFGLLKDGRKLPHFADAPAPFGPPDKLGDKDPNLGLPPGWKAAWDPTQGRMFYMNKETKETSWNKPAGTNITSDPTNIRLSRIDKATN